MNLTYKEIINIMDANAGYLSMDTPENLYKFLCNITDVYIEQSLYGKIFGYATLTVTTTGYNLTVKNLAGGAEMRKAILDAAKIKYY